MAIITLTTDWNKSDYYLGAVKGRILSTDPSTQIIDISHQIQAFNIMQAAFVLRNCCFTFPKGTVHIIGVNAALSEKVNLLVIELNGHYFISTDNGIVGLLSGDKPDAVYKVSTDDSQTNFLSLDAFVDTAFKIINKTPFNQFTEESTEHQSQIPYRPVIDKNLINGSIIYIDSFSNAITNISRETFDKVGKGKDFEIFIQSNHYKISKINTTYADSASGDLLAIFNSSDLLEVAIHHGNASELLNLNVNSSIRIKFYDEKQVDTLTLTGG